MIHKYLLSIIIRRIKSTEKVYTYVELSYVAWQMNGKKGDYPINKAGKKVILRGKGSGELHQLLTPH